MSKPESPARAWLLRATRACWLLPRRMLGGLVKAYRLLLSPWLGSSCRFEPSCSLYSIEAYERHGAVVGSALTASRLLRCQPWCKGGHDPVPDSVAASTSRLFTGLIARATKKSSS